MILLDDAHYIPNPITDYAIEHGLTQWDHYYFFLSLFLTLITLAVSSIALYVSCQTLKSQKQTEKNTSPDITPSIQFSLFKSFVYNFSSLVFNLIRFYHFEIDNNNNYKVTTYDLDSYWNYNPNDYLFERVYYNDIDKFNSFMSFIEECKRFRIHLERIKTLEEHKKTKEEIQEMFINIFTCAGSVLSQSIVVSETVFDLSESDILKNFVLFFGNHTEFDISEELQMILNKDKSLDENRFKDKLANIKNNISLIEKRICISKEFIECIESFSRISSIHLVTVVYKDCYFELISFLMEAIKLSFLENLDFFYENNKG